MIKKMLKEFYEDLFVNTCCLMLYVIMVGATVALCYAIPIKIKDMQLDSKAKEIQVQLLEQQLKETK